MNNTVSADGDTTNMFPMTLNGASVIYRTTLLGPGSTMPILEASECNSGPLETFSGEQKLFYLPITLQVLYGVNIRPSISSGVRWMVGFTREVISRCITNHNDRQVTDQSQPRIPISPVGQDVGLKDMIIGDWAYKEVNGPENWFIPHFLSSQTSLCGLLSF
jgi:hypothetical protein